MSDDKITIKELLEYPDKIYSRLGKIDIEGTLKRINPSKLQRKEATENQKGYHFTAQFIVIDDETASIGVNVTYPGDGPALTKEAQGKRVKIENAEAGSYQGQKGTQRVLNRGKAFLLEKIEPPKETPTEKPESKNDYTTVPQEVWERKKLIETKTWVAIKFIEVCKKWDKQIEKQAKTALEWIYNNIDKDKKDEQDKQEITNQIKELRKLEEKFEKNEWREILAGFDIKEIGDIKSTGDAENILNQIKDMVKAKEMEEE